jgi:eukaryotic translation initiation factor 2C
MTSVGSTPVPELPRLHENVEGSMFFCWGAAERLL